MRSMSSSGRRRPRSPWRGPGWGTSSWALPAKLIRPTLSWSGGLSMNSRRGLGGFIRFGDVGGRHRQRGVDGQDDRRSLRGHLLGHDRLERTQPPGLPPRPESIRPRRGAASQAAGGDRVEQLEVDGPAAGAHAAGRRTEPGRRRPNQPRRSGCRTSQSSSVVGLVVGRSVSVISQRELSAGAAVRPARPVGGVDTYRARSTSSPGRFAAADGRLRRRGWRRDRGAPCRSLA